MPLRPATPVPLILVRAYVLTRQETGYLLRTGGITAVPTLYGPCTRGHAVRPGGW